MKIKQAVARGEKKTKKKRRGKNLMQQLMNAVEYEGMIFRESPIQLAIDKIAIIQ